MMNAQAREGGAAPVLTTHDALDAARRLAANDADTALTHLRTVFRMHPEHREATQLLGSILKNRGDRDWRARAKALSRSVECPELLEAGRLLARNEIAAAETLLSRRSNGPVDEPSAARLLAQVAARSGRFDEAETSLKAILAAAPDFSLARYDLARLYYECGRLPEALQHVELALRNMPDDPQYSKLTFSVLTRLGRQHDALSLSERALAQHPNDVALHLCHGVASSAMGRNAEAVAAFRRATKLEPGSGEAWWNLANLKTYQFSEQEIDRMMIALAAAENDMDRMHLHFALGKATGDLGFHRESFGHYCEANRLRSRAAHYDPEWVTEHVTRSRAAFDRQFHRSRQGWGAACMDPIFIVGMPRAGSTLVEQILSSHSLIEGTSELPYVPGFAKRVSDSRAMPFPDYVTGLSQQESAQHGYEYLLKARPHRHERTPHFIDKNPNNWLFIDFIATVLPHAKIIDVRRDPLDCGVSNFKQHFARGQGFSCSFGHFGRYYSDYVRMMRGLDEVLPGRVHRIIYEELVADPDTQIRRMFAYLDLPFECQCLAFHENARIVRTPSAEQVRRPINRDGIGQWRHFARWIAPLEAGLGPVAQNYR